MIVTESVVHQLVTRIARDSETISALVAALEVAQGALPRQPVYLAIHRQIDAALKGAK